MVDTEHVFFVSTGRCGTKSAAAFFERLGDIAAGTGLGVEVHHERNGQDSLFHRDPEVLGRALDLRVNSDASIYVETSHALAKFAYDEVPKRFCPGSTYIIALVRHPVEVALSLAARGTRIRDGAYWHLGPSDAKEFPWFREDWDEVDRFIWEWFEVHSRGLRLRDWLVNHQEGLGFRKVRFWRLQKDLRSLGRFLDLPEYYRVNVPRLNSNPHPTPTDQRGRLDKFLLSLPPDGQKAARRLLHQLDVEI